MCDENTVPPVEPVTPPVIEGEGPIVKANSGGAGTNDPDKKKEN